jgi:carbonic anhydrase/acetyltransferase-like protein (isoleucine patch superfamily)
MFKFKRRTQMLLLTVMLLSGLMGSVTVSAGGLASGGPSFVDPTAVVSGNFTIGSDDYVGPFTAISAKPGFSVQLKDKSNFQDNETISADTKNTVVGERAIVAHGAAVKDSNLGNFTFIGFNSVIENATLEEGAFIAHGVRISGVTIPKDKFVNSGMVINNASQVANLPTLTQANIDFKNEVIEVNEELAHGYDALLKKSPDNVKGVDPSPSTSWAKANVKPQLGAGVKLATNVRVIGAVKLGANSSVGNSTAIRGDEGMPIVIGDGAQLGEQVTFHALKHQAIGIGQNLKAGKHVVFHGALTMGNNVTVGDNAIVFNSTIGSNITIGNNALVIGVKLPDGAKVPDGKILTDQKEADALAPAGAPVTSAPVPQESEVLPASGVDSNGEWLLVMVVLAVAGAVFIVSARVMVRRS